MTSPDPILKVHFGRDWFRLIGWSLIVVLMPARRLMTEADEGRIILSVLQLEARFMPPLLFGRWRWPLSVSMHSDADEIAARLAQGVHGHD